MDLRCARGGGGFVRELGVRARTRRRRLGIRFRFSVLLLPRALLLPCLLSLSVFAACAGCRSTTGSRLHRAAGCPRIGLLVLLRRSKGLLSLREGMPRRLAEGRPATAELR